MCSDPVEPAAPLTIDVVVRRIRPEDVDACAGFSCGPDEWHVDVADFLTRKYWQPGRPQEHVIIGYEAETDAVFGFGCWKHTTTEVPQQQAPIPVIRLPYFGVDARYQGARDNDGHSWAGRLYRTLEEDALGHADSAENMPIDLFCDSRNERGLRFWNARGFEVVREAYGHLLHLLRVPG